MQFLSSGVPILPCAMTTDVAARSVTDLPVMAAAVAPICEAANPAAKLAAVLLMSITSRPYRGRKKGDSRSAH